MNIKRSIFKALIFLYPRPYRDHFEESLLQTFDDMDRDGEISSWFVIKDTVLSIPLHYTNYFQEIMNTKLGKAAMIALAAAIIFIAGALVNQVIILQKAHSTFANYYAFRGCVQLLQKADTYGLCKISSGVTIKIVEIGGKWYLDGDGPGVW